jgi:hypothetical protein
MFLVVFPGVVIRLVVIRGTVMLLILAMEGWNQQEGDVALYCCMPIPELDRDQCQVGVSSHRAKGDLKCTRPVAMVIGSGVVGEMSSAWEADDHPDAKLGVIVGLHHEVVPGTNPHDVIPQ